MVELMAMLIIIGLLAALVVTKVASKIDDARVTTTKANLKALHSSVIEFYMDTHRYPSEEVGLIELVERPPDVTDWQPGGYLETTEVTKDGWGSDFIYQRFAEQGRPFVIISYGADGEEGGEGINKDLKSTDAY